MKVRYTLEFQQDVWDRMDEQQQAEWLDEVREAVNNIAYVSNEELMEGN